MSWAGMKKPSKHKHTQSDHARQLTRHHRIQEKCQPRDDTGYDEDWYDLISAHLVGQPSPPKAQRSANVGLSGHVERTNDRDYEVEERYAISRVTQRSWVEKKTGDTGLWNQRPIGYRKKQRATWIP
jgi:hypothetical protein